MEWSDALCSWKWHSSFCASTTKAAVANSSSNSKSNTSKRNELKTLLGKRHKRSEKNIVGRVSNHQRHIYLSTPIHTCYLLFLPVRQNFGCRTGDADVL